MIKIEAKDERYILGSKTAVDVVATTSKNPMESPIKSIGLVMMDGEQEIDGETTHLVREVINFVDRDNLELAQMGLELLQKAIFNEQELADSKCPNGCSEGGACSDCPK